MRPRSRGGTSVFESLKIQAASDALRIARERLEASVRLLDDYRKIAAILRPQEVRFFNTTARSPTVVHPLKIGTSKNFIRTSNFVVARHLCQTLPPIRVERLTKESEERKYPRCIRAAIHALRLITRCFGVDSGDEVIEQMKKLQTAHISLKETAEELKEELPALQNRRDLVQRAIEMSEWTVRGMNRMLDEGMDFYDEISEELEDANQESRELAAQNKAIVKSITRIGGLCNLESTKTPEIEMCADLLKKINEYLTKDPEIMKALKKLRAPKPKPSPKKDAFTVVGLTSSARRLASIPEVPQVPPVPFSPSRLSEDIYEDPDQQNVISFGSEESQGALVSVPSLSLAAAVGKGDYVPKTRSTRRAFSAINSLRTPETEQTDVDQEMLLIGTAIGHIFVERYGPEIMDFSKKICAEPNEYSIGSPREGFRQSLEGQKTASLLQSMFDFYRRFKAYLHLLVFDEYEISITDKSFLDFMVQREQYIDVFDSRDDYDIFPKFFSNVFVHDENVALWIARDMVSRTRVQKLIAVILQRLSPPFQRKQQNVSSSMELDEAEEFVAWIATFATFHEVKHSSATETQMAMLITGNTSKLIPVFAKYQKKSVGRAGLLSSCRLACYMPNLFHMHIDLQNKATSLIHNFIRANSHYPSCVKAATEFFSAARGFLDEETIMWHTAIFFHLIMSEMCRPAVRVDNFIHYLSVMTVIVANRQPFTMEQLGRLNFLPFLIRNFQLEEFVSRSANNAKKIDQLRLPTFELKLPPQVGNKPKQVSYLDIPKIPMRPGLPSLNLENPKLQLHFQPVADSNYKTNDTAITESEYLVKREEFPIYLTSEIHCNFVQLMFATLIDHTLHKLDVFFCDPFPQVNRKPNVLYTLMKHMESKHNADISSPLEDCFTPPEVEEEPEENIPLFSLGRIRNDQMSSTIWRQPRENNMSLILESVQEEGEGGEPTPLQHKIELPRLSSTMLLQPFKSVPNFIANTSDSEDDDDDDNGSREQLPTAFSNDQLAQFQDYMRLLKLTVPELFDPSKYSNGQHIGSGAFGAVMAVTLDNQLYAVKVLEKSRNEFDNPHLVEVFTEVSILEGCKGDRRVTQLTDYGCTQDSYYIVMEFYPSTLKGWRKKFSPETGNPPEDVVLRLFREFLNCCSVLTERKINHFDIKCDNVMLDKHGYPAIADFGEAMNYKNEQNCYTLLNKGTEWIKSPEMLSIALNSSATNPNYDRRRKVGAGPASDVWSIGCLFFELVTGEFLFLDSDWSRFFLRITNPDQPLLTDKNKEMLGNPKYVSFLEFVLQRSVRHRPNMKQVTVKFDEMFPDAMKGRLPELEMPKFSDPV